MTQENLRSAIHWLHQNNMIILKLHAREGESVTAEGLGEMAILGILNNRNALAETVPEIRRELNRWTVNGTRENYIVKQYEDNYYSCSCPVFVSRRQVCHHIKSVKIRNPLPLGRPRIITAQGLTPQYIHRDNLILLPVNLVNANETYAMLLEYGYSIAEIKARYNIRSQSGILFDDIAATKAYWRVRLRNINGYFPENPPEIN